MGAIIPLLIWGAALAQTPAAGPVDALVEKLDAYLAAYERQLSEVVCDEQLDQQDARREPAFNRLKVVAERRLDSEVAFVRLPGGGYWFGIRDTAKVDGKAMADGRLRIADLIAGRLDLDGQRAAIVAASTRYNLGVERTVNMPTVPLAILQGMHRGLLRFARERDEAIRGVRVAVLSFDEIGESTLVLHVKAGRVKTRGRVWIEPATGRVWRVEIDCRDPGDRGDDVLAGNVTVRVDFAADRGLGFLVPSAMVETFPTAAGRGTGTAKYSNYRRFQTSARIVPPPAE